MMKRVGSLILLVLLALTMTITAGASENMESYEEVGMRLPAADMPQGKEGLFIPYPYGAIDDDHHVYELDFYYVAMPIDEAKRILYTSDSTEEEKEASREATGMIGMVLAGDVDLDTMKEEFAKTYNVDELNFDAPEELGSADGFTFYYIPAQNYEEYLSAIGETFAEEFGELEKTIPELLKGAEIFEPVDHAKEMIGQKISFTTTDIDGNTVTSEELFSGNEITMLNCWGTWCHYCVDEMADLARIHTNIQKKGCGIVGLEYERDQDPAELEKGREMMKEWGTNYPNVLLPEEMRKQIDGYPFTIFVDKEGNVLGMPIVGAAVGLYENRLDSLLAGEEAGEEPEEKAEAVAVYHVNVTDENGPVEDVAVKLCNENSCRFHETDENGVATFEVPAGFEYEVEIQELPDGYEEDNTIYHTTEGSSEVNIVLKKSE